MIVWANTRIKIKTITRIATKIAKAEPIFRLFGGRAVRGRAHSERLDTAAAQRTDLRNRCPHKHLCQIQDS